MFLHSLYNQTESRCRCDSRFGRTALDPSRNQAMGPCRIRDPVTTSISTAKELRMHFKTRMPVRVGLIIAVLTLVSLVGIVCAQEPQPAKVEAKANRLAKETSPYLLLHAHNPVDWYAWGPEALAKAKDEKKPIFLSVGYSSCYWCHVMERESFVDRRNRQGLERKLCLYQG